MRWHVGAAAPGSNFKVERLDNLEIGGLLREPTPVMPRAPPWESAAEGVNFQTTTIRPTKHTDPPNKRLEAVRQTLAELLPVEIHFLHVLSGERTGPGHLQRRDGAKKDPDTSRTLDL